MSLRTDLIKILAGMEEDHAGTYEKLEEYIINKQREAFEAAQYPATPSPVTGMNDLMYDSFEEYKQQLTKNQQ